MILLLKSYKGIAMKTFATMMLTKTRYMNPVMIRNMIFCHPVRAHIHPVTRLRISVSPFFVPFLITANLI